MWNEKPKSLPIVGGYRLSSRFEEVVGKEGAYSRRGVWLLVWSDSMR